MIREFLSLIYTDLWITIFDAGLRTAPLWGTAILVLLWWSKRMEYLQRKWVNSQGSLLLEIKIPKELPKSPQAMEMFLNSLYNIFPGNLIKVYGEGAMRPWFSLEMVSIGGEVHFYIWMHAKFRALVEPQIYAQFPGVEVNEVDDYALKIVHDPEKINFGWFGQLGLTQADAYPIKTYIDYELDENPKEEYKHDPMVSLLEFLGSLRKGEQAWIQILIQGHAKEGLRLGRIIPKPNWKKDVEKEIAEIIKKATLKTEDQKMPSVLNLSKGQQETIGAMERHLGKWAFDTMIRTTYFAEKDAFNGMNIGGLLSSFRQFSSNTLNGLRPIWNAGFEYPSWQDFRGIRKMRNERAVLDAYKRRSFFAPPYKNFHAKPFIMTTEELATMYHFPSLEVAATPTLVRIPSKKSEAPANLPI